MGWGRVAGVLGSELSLNPEVLVLLHTLELGDEL